MRKNINIILKKNILIILLMISMCPILGFSYARFVINTDSYRSNEMYMAELLYTVKIDDVSTYTLTIDAGANEEEHIIEITSLNAVSTNYKLIYQNNSNVKIEYASDYIDPAFGGILTKRTIMLRLTNNTDVNQTLSFSVVGGYSFNTLDEIDIPEGYIEVNLEYWKYDYETMAIYLNNTRVDTLSEDKFYDLVSYTCNNSFGNLTITYDIVKQELNVPINNSAKCSLYFEEMDNPIYTFDYTGTMQILELPRTGYYKLEVWGAQGGGNGGYGSYSQGIINLDKKENIYIYIGGQGSNIAGGYNGGGKGQYQAASTTNAAYGGGGATHIAKYNGKLSTLSSNIIDILIVAGAGGGGSENNKQGGNAGGFIGNSGSGSCYIATGGSQTSGGTAGDSDAKAGGFGYGGDAPNGTTTSSTWGAGGGGSGFYGGGGNSFESGSSCAGGGAGGSGYIGNSLLTDKVMYCYNCTISNDESTKTLSNTCVNSSPTENCSKTGNGYARITYVGNIN